MALKIREPFGSEIRGLIYDIEAGELQLRSGGLLKGIVITGITQPIRAEEPVTIIGCRFEAKRSFWQWLLRRWPGPVLMDTSTSSSGGTEV